MANNEIRSQVPEVPDVERAEDSSRSHAVAADEEENAYRSGTARQRARRSAFERAESWKALSHDVRYRISSAVGWIGFAFTILVTLTLLYAGVIALVHFTIPVLAWLDESELETLGQFYAKAAVFVAPTALISNAWLIALFSWKRSNEKPDEDELN